MSIIDKKKVENIPETLIAVGIRLGDSRNTLQGPSETRRGDTPP